MYSAQAVARSIIDCASVSKIEITNLKLQKLLYIAHGTMLAFYNEPLLEGSFSAWKYGPVVEGLYHDLKVFGSDAIKSSDFYIKNWPTVPRDNKNAYTVIAAVLENFGKRTGGDLIKWSHDVYGPWHAVYQDTKKGVEISNDAIKEYFQQRVIKNQQN